ncbi:MAG: hypothetical protein U9R69_03900 [Thermodesulfobacteriota bacterium]|nr:hypothetical protein [Thermodesulfobacteriota bacterium]
MRTKYFFILVVLVLTLNACGKKGPVRPIDTPPDTVQTNKD